MDNFRWKTAEEETYTSPTLFPVEETITRHVGRGEYKGLEFLEVNAKKIINAVPTESRVSFNYTINAYRGCSHACTYCLVGETPVLMGDGRTKLLSELSVGDIVYGTERIGTYRRFVKTTVLVHWKTLKPGYRVILGDGTRFIASSDHRFLSDRGWKHVYGTEQGPQQRPHLTSNNRLIGTGKFAIGPKQDLEYRMGYLCGMIRGDANIGTYIYNKRKRRDVVHRFRLALKDAEALSRSREYLVSTGIETTEFLFHKGSDTRSPMYAIRTSKSADVQQIRELIEWPSNPSEEWAKGFLAGIFDAEGSCSRGVFRICNGDTEIIHWIVKCFERFEFAFAVEPLDRPQLPLYNVRLVGGLSERLRFFHLTNPAITRKRDISGAAIKMFNAPKVVSVQNLGFAVPMYDITTGTGDFIADGAISHNCFARPTHEYLGLNIGKDFETKIVVKVNAVERLRAELKNKRWKGDHIAMGTNTDPYQKAEGKYHLTQGIIGVLTEFENPFSILTKSTLILRDLDLLVKAHERMRIGLNFSIGTLDEKVWRSTEPGTPHPMRRVEAVAKFRDAGIDCGVLVAPILPGLSDGNDQLRDVVRACRDAGATRIIGIPLHLRRGVKGHYFSFLHKEHPRLLRLYQSLYRGSNLRKDRSQEISAMVNWLASEEREDGE